MQGGFGPAAAAFPAVATPAGCDRVTFARERLLAAAKHYIGLPYQHHHVPGWNPSSAWSGAEGPGLDCSNFTSWVYNFGLGIKFTSNVVDQGDGSSAPGRVLSSSEPLQLGDLLYITSADGSVIAHVVMFIDEGHIIDDTGPGVAVRAFTGWYKTRYSHARRIIE
jgi:cell wall-associated NlpC family hydrolase